MLLDGKMVSNQLFEDLAEKYKNIKTTICIIQVNDCVASDKYIMQKKKMADLLGVKFIHEKISDCTTEDICNIIDKYNLDSSVNGIIVQLPLPDNIDYDTVRNRINPYKDIDGVCDINIGRLVTGEDTFIPCTVLGIITLLDYYKIDVSSSDVSIIGRGIHTGKALSNVLINRNATVSLLHSKTRDISKYTRNSDIIISSVGISNFITNEMVRDNSILIDIGFNYLDGKITGDISKDITNYKYLTPVPGGVGPMTVVSIFSNLYKAYLLQEKNN